MISRPLRARLQIVMGDALAVALLEQKGFTAEDFAFTHPGDAWTTLVNAGI